MPTMHGQPHPFYTAEELFSKQSMKNTSLLVGLEPTMYQVL